jgi:hypothetical protein
MGKLNRVSTVATDRCFGGVKGAGLYHQGSAGSPTVACAQAKRALADVFLCRDSKFGIAQPGLLGQINGGIFTFHTPTTCCVRRAVRLT